MEKRFYQFIKRQTKSLVQIDEVIQFITDNYIKPLFTDLPLKQLIDHIKLKQWQAQSVIFKENDKIQDFYFLIQGNINLYRKVYINQQQSVNQIVKNINQPCLFSDSFFTQNHLHNHNRMYTAVTNDSQQSTKGFIIQKSIFERYFSCLSKQYKILKNYLCQFLQLQDQRISKLNLYQCTKVRKFMFGQQIKLQGQIFVIFQGQCLMKFQQKAYQDKHNSPFKSKSKKSSVYRPLIKLCQNQCFGMQKMVNLQFNSYQKTIPTFKYIASSEKLVCISIPLTFLKLFPKQLQQKIMKFHQNHLLKLSSNIYYKNKIFEELNNHERGKLSEIQLIQESRVFPLTFDEQVYKLKKSKRNQEKMLTESSLNNSHIKVKFTNILTDKQKSQQINSVEKHVQVKKTLFRLPKINAKYKNQTIQKENYLSYSSFHRLNKTQILNNSDLNTNKVASPCISIHPNQITQLKKRYCIGYYLKNKCDKETENLRAFKKKEVIKQPKGYFLFSKRKIKIDNKFSSQHTKRLEEKTTLPHSDHKEWGQYLKLPKIIKSETIRQMC